MKTPHKHAALIKAWADGAEIEVYWNGKWEETVNPVWNTQAEYRIKPKPKPDFCLCRYIGIDVDNYLFLDAMAGVNIIFTFDGETRKLKKAEVIE